jgi:hypothetical protein
MTTPAILSYYVPSGDPVTGSASQVAPDWANNRIMGPANGSSSNDGIRYFYGYVSGDQVISANLQTIGILTGGNGVQISNGNAFALSPGGTMLFPENLSNSTTLALVDARTLRLVSQFGISSSSTSPSPTGGNRICSPGSIAPLRYNSTDFFVAVSLYSLEPGEVNLLTCPGLYLKNLGTTTQPDAIVGGYTNVNGVGTMFVIGRQKPGGTAVGTFGLYTVTVSASDSGTLHSIATVNVTSIDPTWTTYSSVSGAAVDQTDGNPIIMVSTTNAVTNQNYIVKLNASTGAVIWATAIPFYDLWMDTSCKSHSIKNQTFYYLYYHGATGTLYTFNTANGTFTTQVIGSLSSAGQCVSEDTNNSIIVYGQWSETTTHPTYLGDYMGTQGNHTISTNTWLRYFPGGVTGTFPVTPSPVLSPTISSVHTWSYTQDGHTFYVLDLGAQGTFVFDTTTQQWSQFQTQGYAGWNMVNGSMWGQRVIAGDSATGYVYELDPGALTDNGVDIQHTVTGGLTQRSRVYRSCDRVILSLSWGEEQDTSNATISLSWTDDYGETWSTPMTLDLAEGDFTSEVVWRSLGSFAAPGRIFSVTDTGGPLRIDGADASIDGFDDDQPQEQA